MQKIRHLIIFFRTPKKSLPVIALPANIPAIVGVPLGL